MGQQWEGERIGNGEKGKIKLEIYGKGLGIAGAA
jgi:hypothetical protein